MCDIKIIYFFYLLLSYLLYYSTAVINVVCLAIFALPDYYQFTRTTDFVYLFLVDIFSYFPKSFLLNLEP